jgi:hypothetical protein
VERKHAVAPAPSGGKAYPIVGVGTEEKVTFAFPCQNAFSLLPQGSGRISPSHFPL